MRTSSMSRRPFRKFVPGFSFSHESLALEPRMLAAVTWQRTSAFTGFSWQSDHDSILAATKGPDIPSATGVWTDTFTDTWNMNDPLHDEVWTASGSDGLQFTDTGTAPGYTLDIEHINPTNNPILGTTVTISKLDAEYEYDTQLSSTLDWKFVDSTTGLPTSKSLSGVFTISHTFVLPTTGYAGPLSGSDNSTFSLTSDGISASWSASGGGLLTVTYDTAGGGTGHFSQYVGYNFSESFSFTTPSESGEHIHIQVNNAMVFYGGVSAGSATITQSTDFSFKES